MKQSYVIEWTEKARGDLYEIVEYISLDDLVASKNVSARLYDRVLSLELSPERGRVVPELAKLGFYSFRELIVSPWRIVYRVEARVVFIELIVDGRRDLDDLLYRRLMR